MSRGPYIKKEQKRAIALSKAAGVSWTEMERQHLVHRETISRVLKEGDTQAFIAHLRAAAADKLEELYHATLDSLLTQLKTCTNARDLIRYQAQAMRILSMDQGEQKNLRPSEAPIITIDQRQQPQPQGVSLKQLLLAMNPAEEEKPN